MATSAAILCGGEGKRLRPLTFYFQKTMVPIGAHKRPLLEYVVRLLVHHGVRKITLLTGYRADEIENYFGDGARFGASISYSQDRQGSLGSATALSRALLGGTIAKSNELLVYYGDVLSSLDIGELLKVHRKTKARATLVLDRGYRVPVGVAKVEGGLVRSFEEKPKIDISAATGSMVFGTDALSLLKEYVGNKDGFDLMTHFVPKLLSERMKVAAFYVRGFWYDVGSIESYERLSNEVIEKNLAFLERG